MKIRGIIREEIDKYLITENLNQLTQHRNNLINQSQQLVNYCTGFNKAIINEINQALLNYTFQIIHAIKRCVTKNSLFEYRDWGINLPPELGGNIQNHFNYGYNYTKNLLSGGQTKTAANNNNIPQQYGENRLQTVKLSILLQQLNSYQRRCSALKTKYPQQLNGNVGNQMDNILNEIQRTSQTYNQLVSAQQQQQQQNQQQQQQNQQQRP